MVSRLSRQVEVLNADQRKSQQIVIHNSQPSSILGVPTWKVVGVAATVGVICWKVQGYEMRDLVYMSKRHFTDAAATIKGQLEMLDGVVTQAKQSLLESIGLVDAKVEEARVSIESKLDTDLARVDESLMRAQSDLSVVSACASESRSLVHSLSSAVCSVKNQLWAIGSEVDVRLSHVQSKMSELCHAHTSSSTAVRKELDLLDEKLDGLTRSAEDSVIAIQQGLNQQSRGLSLLCEYAVQSSEARPNLLRDLSDFAKAERGSRAALSQNATVFRAASPTTMAVPRPSITVQ